MKYQLAESDVLPPAIQRLQQERDNFFVALFAISRFQTPEQLRRGSEREYGLPFEEALEYAYENIRGLAATAIKGRRKPK